MTEIPSTRSEARRLGVKFYFTGKPCKNGHMANRYASGAGCVPCAKERQKRWIADNIDHVREHRNAAMREYRKDPEFYERQRESDRRSQRKRYANNPVYRQRQIDNRKERAKRPEVREQENARARERRANDPDQRRKEVESTMRWYSNPDRAESVATYRSRQRTRRDLVSQLMEHLTEEEWEKVVTLELCRNELNGDGDGRSVWHVDHILPVKHGGLTVPWNLQLLPASDNIRKRDKVEFGDESIRDILRQDIEFLKRAPENEDARKLMIKKQSQLEVSS